MLIVWNNFTFMTIQTFTHYGQYCDWILKEPTILYKFFFFNYLDPPTVTSIAIEDKFSNGTKYSLYCQVDDGNPSKYAISWSQTFSKRVVRTNQDLSNLQSNNGHNLTLTDASYQDIGVYTCSVHNNVTDLNGNLLQNKSMSINRNCKYKFRQFSTFTLNTTCRMFLFPDDYALQYIC